LRKLSSELEAELRKRSNTIRKHIIEMSFSAQAGHQGGALSLAEIMAVLYFHVLNIDPTHPGWAERDRLVLSKGHGCLALYSALAQRGFFPESEMSSFDQIGSILQGHPDMLKTPGVDISSGCLGQGLSVGIGMALGGRLDRADYRVYVILGDGELQSGQIWEAAMTASAYHLDKLIAILDRNRLQMDGFTEEMVPIEPIRERWISFGWRIMEIDGHKIEAIVKALNWAAKPNDKPTLIIAETVKGKGVSFMELDNKWHGKAPKKEELEKALAEIEEKY